MKRIFLLSGLVFYAVLSTAQTNVERVVPTRATGNGVIYSLPKTAFIVNVEVTKTTKKAGPYFRYAERYLGIKDIVTEDAVFYELGRLTIVSKGIPDPNQTYKIEFNQKTVAPFVYLTRDGLLCAINQVYTPEFADEEKKVEHKEMATFSTSVYSEDLLRAGNEAKQAEIASKEIYELRESLKDLITGNADNMPTDGEGLKLRISKIEEREKAWVQLFTGIVSKETTYYDVEIIPEDELEREVLFRFSTKLGILDADDLGGEPVYMNLRALDRIPELDPKEAEKKARSKGVVYNKPGRGRAEIIFNNRTLARREMLVVQFGIRDILLPVLLEDKKQPVKVLFYPETGSINKIN